MRRTSTVYTIPLLILMLCSCGSGLVYSTETTIQFANDHAELLDQCVDEICSDSLSNSWCSVLIFSENGQLFMCKNTVDREKAKTEIESPELSELFNSQEIKMIRIWKSGDSLKSIEFLMESTGMSSTSSALIEYIPTDNVEDSAFYSQKMHFYSFREGYMGEIDGSDDYLYYVRIIPKYYYIEHGF